MRGALTIGINVDQILASSSRGRFPVALSHAAITNDESLLLLHTMITRDPTTHPLLPAAEDHATVRLEGMSLYDC